MTLLAGDYRLVVAPERGGSILRFDWRDEALMRPAAGDTILDVACFPMVPFCNRIAGGRFSWGRREVRLPTNFPGRSHPHPLHGFGWLAGWRVIECAGDQLLLEHHYAGGAWPWAYRATLDYQLGADGLTTVLAVENLSDNPMPAGLGFHPWFPLTNQTRYRGLHKGEWHSDDDSLPLRLLVRPAPADWWQGGPASARIVDTVYSGRDGPLEITWPERDLALVIRPSENLIFTAVFVPRDAGWFCIEPQSQMTNAVSWPGQDSGLATLEPGETLTVSVRMAARRTGRSTSAQ